VKTLRRLAYLSLALAYVQIVFGAIVRITGSGMGCGDHWPRCMGRWFPPLDRPDLIIEISHRYIASALILSIIALVVTAFMRRSRGADFGRVFNAALFSMGMVAAVAVLGAVTVKLGLHPYIVVIHLIAAMSVLAVLAVTVLRAGGFGADGDLSGTSPRTFRAAGAAVMVVFLILVMGALTANIPGAAGSCGGFPWCRAGMTSGPGLHIQLTHRILAFLLLFHMMGVVLGIMKRGAAGAVTRAAWIAFGCIILQIFVAAALVEMKLPHGLQSLHQAVGTLVWLSVFVFAMLSRQSVRESA
jgi:cytochrome c oxidase assembly protein subunit 15